MKNLTILFAFAFSILATAQQQKPEKLTLSQRATLQAKKMQLALDLTDKQTNKLVNIFKSNPKPRSKNKSDIHAYETNYQKQLNRLNQQLLIQKEIKKLCAELLPLIVGSDQYRDKLEEISLAKEKIKTILKKKKI